MTEQVPRISRGQVLNISRTCPEHVPKNSRKQEQNPEQRPENDVPDNVPKTVPQTPATSPPKVLETFKIRPEQKQ